MSTNLQLHEHLENDWYHKMKALDFHQNLYTLIAMCVQKEVFAKLLL